MTRVVATGRWINTSGMLIDLYLIRSDSVSDKNMDQNVTASLPLPLISTFEPCIRRGCPSVTTTSSGLSPLSTTATPLTARVDTTGRTSTVESRFTTYTN